MPEKSHPMAETILLRAAPNAAFPSHTVRLEQVTAGWELAGAGTRETAGYVAVRQTTDGTTHGRKFRSYTAAVAEFERLTGGTPHDV